MLDKNLLLELQEYVERHLIRIDYFICDSPTFVERDFCKSVHSNELKDFINNNRKPTFSQVLFSFIDKKGAIDTDIYKKAGIDRRHFSKIRSNPDYHPGKNTAIALALSLKLNSGEVGELLSSAGYSLTDNDTFDLIIQFFIVKKIYDIHFLFLYCCCV